MQKLIDQSFLQYDDRTKALVTLAYEKAKNETIDLLRQENASSFKNIEAAANAKIKQMDEKMESDTLIVDAKLAVILEEKKKSDEKFDYLNAMQVKAQEGRRQALQCQPAQHGGLLLPLACQWGREQASLSTMGSCAGGFRAHGPLTTLFPLQPG